MPALLATDHQVSVSFSCTGGLPANLPPWVLIKPRKSAAIRPKNGVPFYTKNEPLLPSGVSRTITRRNRLSLSRVSAREKIWPDQSMYTVLTFVFRSDDVCDHESLSIDGIAMLQDMLDIHWRKVLMFRQPAIDQMMSLNMTFSRQIIVKGKPTYAPSDEWGIKTITG